MPNQQGSAREYLLNWAVLGGYAEQLMDSRIWIKFLHGGH